MAASQKIILTLFSWNKQTSKQRSACSFSWLANFASVAGNDDTYKNCCCWIVALKRTKHRIKTMRVDTHAGREKPNPSMRRSSAEELGWSTSAAGSSNRRAHGPRCSRRTRAPDAAPNYSGSPGSPTASPGPRIHWR